MSTQHNVRIIYGFPVRRVITGTRNERNEVYLEEWLDNIGSTLSPVSSGHYDSDGGDHVGVIIAEVDDYCYGSTGAVKVESLTVSKESVDEVMRVRVELCKIDPALVLGDTGFYLMGEAS